jgi:hypothetical protein
MAQGKKIDRIIEPTESDKAYAAGFIDGEGCITVRLSHGREGVYVPGASFYASLTISQCERVSLDWFSARWGGAVRALSKRTDIRNESPAWEWCVVGQKFYRCMDDVLSMLKTKRPHAMNALELRGLRNCRGWSTAPMSPEEVTERQAIREQAHRLNLRGRDRLPVEEVYN